MLYDYGAASWSIRHDPYKTGNDQKVQTKFDFKTETTLYRKLHTYIDRLDIKQRKCILERSKIIDCSI